MAQPTKRCVPAPRINPITDLRILPDGAALARAAADLLTAAAKTAVAARGRFLVALSGGSTPQALFKLLAQPPYSTAVPWAQTEVYWGDERLVPPDDPASNYYHARRLLLDHVPIPAQQVHRMRGELAAERAVAEYTAVLQQTAAPDRLWPHLDLALLGLGADGHTASLFPGSADASDPVIAVSADYQGRPAARVSLTPLVLNDARRLLFLVAGEDKAPALAAVVEGPLDLRRLPAQRLANSPGDLIWLVDKAAAADLK